MALNHLLPGQTQALIPAGAQPAEFQSQALFKSQDLEVIRLLLPEGKRLPGHSVSGDITLHCVRGCVDVGSHACGSADPRPTARLVEGELLYLQGGEQHDLLAVVSSVVIATIALRGAA